MCTVDIILLCCLIPGLILGIKNGAVKQVVAFLIVYLGINLSLNLADSVSTWLLSHFTMSAFWAKAASFVIIFVAVAIVLGLLGKLVESIIKATTLGWVNRLLGAVFAVVVSFLAISFVVYLVDVVNAQWHFLPNAEMEKSSIYPRLLDAAKSIFPHLRQLFQ